MGEGVEGEERGARAGGRDCALHSRGMKPRTSIHFRLWNTRTVPGSSSMLTTNGMIKPAAPSVATFKSGLSAQQRPVVNTANTLPISLVAHLLWMTTLGFFRLAIHITKPT